MVLKPSYPRFQESRKMSFLTENYTLVFGHSINCFDFFSTLFPKWTKFRRCLQGRTWFLCPLRDQNPEANRIKRNQQSSTWTNVCVIFDVRKRFYWQVQCPQFENARTLLSQLSMKENGKSGRDSLRSIIPTSCPYQDFGWNSKVTIEKDLPHP